jgi:hypothetical protein
MKYNQLLGYFGVLSKGFTDRLKKNHICSLLPGYPAGLKRNIFKPDFRSSYEKTLGGGFK